MAFRALVPEPPLLHDGCMNRPLRTLLALCSLVAALYGARLLAAQDTPPQPPATAPSQEPSTPQPQPDDISGTYTFLRDGEYLQVNVEQKRVSGFVSRFADDSKDSAFLTHFFKEAALEKEKLTFTTRTVNAVWFEFKGKVKRGAAKTREDEGYFVLEGTLTRHQSDVNGKDSAQSRKVEFKLFPETP
jgi:hypothetical protein